MVDVYASEEEQVAAIKKWWKENGTSVVLGVVIGGAALFGWRAWQGQIEAKGEQASTIYTQLETQLSSNETAAAKATAQQLMDEYQGTPYASFAALKLAKDAVEADDNEAASTYLQWTIDNGKPAELAQTATLRLARLKLSMDQADQAWTVIQTIEDTSALAAYHEVKGDILQAQGKSEEAKLAYLQATALDPSGPTANAFLELKMDDLGRE